MNSKIEELLENRHTTYLGWLESRYSCSPQGNGLDATVYIKATVHDCINMARANAKEVGRATEGQDRDFLLDFMSTHWAGVVE